MITQSSFRKVFEGVATRAQMFQMFDRHGQAPMSKARLTGRLYDGEWFEIGRAEHDYMFELLPPLWIASGWVDGRAGTAVFALGAAAGSAAAVLRLHLLFAASTLPRELAVQRDRVRPWLRLADGAFVSALALVGAMTLGEHPVGGTTLVAAAVVLLVVSTLVEPATTRAALDDPNRT